MRPSRVVVIGPECTGKTWLAGELGRHYDAPVAPEHAREYVDRHPEALTLADVEPIGRGQKAGEDAAIARAGALGRPLVVLDTDLVSTMVYSRHYYGESPRWIERAAERRLSDLYLLHHVDVEWVPDGRQREQPERREELFARFRATLAGLEAPTVDVAGPWDERRRRAIEAVDALLGQPVPPHPRSGYTLVRRSPPGMDESLRSELVREIQDFLEDRGPRAAEEGAFVITERRLQLAAAVLMVSVVRADLENRPEEQRALERALARALDLGEAEVAAVVRGAERALERGARFPPVLARLSRDCSIGQKRGLVESLWRIAFADAELAGHEEYLVRKVAEQLGLGTADLVETKIRAREDFLGEDR